MNRSQILRLAAETHVSEPTIKKWIADPSTVHQSTCYALEKGCRVLGFDLPQREASHAG